ncbi:hypothetical protein [Blastococcus goldschmidtiae]|uniref:Uncharacterized protein n=1 Tax=Blastococcus goldschmidtiae TaxID=3075546 RepID=A0ABU2KD03_9ACTN|nr:hypothetical protein [Blastococcus sp. DSM 46792]MDT0278054.1 hypothetical protein [Blastococcus sp. DSM 46792]
MSMWTPMEPNLGKPDEGIPAADPGAGAPPPAEGFGVGGEEPDRPEDTSSDEAGEGVAGSSEDPPFRTPDPDEVGPA